MQASWLPKLDASYDLGSASKHWRVLYLSGAANVGGLLTAGSLSVSGSVTLTSALPIAQGGTAATSASAARTSLGLGTLAVLNSPSGASGSVIQHASLGSGKVTVQSGGSPSGGNDGDIYLIY